jgi:hypothetical protein
LQSWTLPEPLQYLRRLLEARMGNRGKREFIQVLRLKEVFPEPIVFAATTDAIGLGALRRCQATGHHQNRTQTRKPQSWRLSLFAGSQGEDDLSFRLCGSRFRERGMTTSASAASPAPPQVLHR